MTQPMNTETLEFDLRSRSSRRPEWRRALRYTRELVRSLQTNGIRVLGSSIVGLEDHTPLNIDERIEHAVSHDTEFHQFMLYTPIPGTPLHAEHKAAGTLLDESEIELADTHGQDRLNYKHPHIKDGQESDFLLRAFQRDFEINGPSVIRVIRTTLLGWQRYKNHPDPRIRARFARESRDLAGSAAGGPGTLGRGIPTNSMKPCFRTYSCSA